MLENRGFNEARPEGMEGWRAKEPMRMGKETVSDRL
jgi:hypothetical protein